MYRRTLTVFGALNYLIKLNIMKTQTSKLLITALTALTLFICTNVNAQSVPKSNWRFGVGVDGLLPVGNTANTLNFGLGLTPRLQYGLSDKVALTFTSGIYHFFPKTVTYPATGSFPGFTTKYKSDIIPVKVGAKFFMGSNFYFGAEFGAGFEVAEGGGSVHFIAAPSIGYATKRWDIGARYENLSGNGYSDGIIGLRVAYGFGL
ncbi:hypothetical protein HK413_06055 [Mucilaginibacter sp. S1162]|uniref:Outer membrane protein beta-barrel domain-containing protein n=1 Tax=Mucilaginibacter humi TaxID=2732510 RepID=A0ABX1W3I3_9SPHI|nr:hypothetical protein [Mucilaginibacter humi]NNU33814.1 hypothetical protein [Mucilaginibacter humi]